ncbi:MAG: hypothetical protein U0871_06395 [Gemmataceae bacterium]
MSGFFTLFEGANDADEFAVRIGKREQVWAVSGVGLVHTSCLRLHLPRVVVVQLGLRVERKAFSRVTPKGREYLDRACDVRITLCGRSAVFTAVVEPFADVTAIGRMVLTKLDLIEDRDRRLLIPRDAQGILTEIE